METVKTIASKIAKTIAWLWTIPGVKNETLTLLARVGIGSTGLVGVLIAVVNAYATNPLTF